MFRAVSYPDHPDSLVVFDVRVVAGAHSEWVTEIAVSGTYTGPTDIVASEDYRLTWVVDGAKLFESGSASLARSSGERLRQTWSSIITPGEGAENSSARFKAFPAGGQVVNATISPFEIAGHRMRYEWKGTVAKQQEGDRRQTR